MSLTLALRTALSGLQLNQTAMQLTANNVSNVNTEGYTRKTVESVTQVVAGTGAGVFPSDILRSVNENLIRDLRDQLHELGKFTVRDEFHTQMQNLFGNPADSRSLTATISTLTEKLEALAAFPEDLTRAQQVIDAADNLARQFNTMATEIQEMRTVAERGIADSTKIVQTELDKIATLNQEIALNFNTNKPTADLLDQRDIALNKISEHIGISYFLLDTGVVQIQSTSGDILLGSTASTITHTPVGGVDATLTYPGGFNGIDINGNDVTTRIKGGRIEELVAMRDATLPNLQAQIDTLSLALRDQINAIHNDGAGLPPANTLTGQLTGLTGATAFAGTGTVRIAVTDGTGNALGVPFDLDLTTVADVTAIMNAINTGLGTLGSASLNASGQLVIAASNANNGIVISEADSDVTATSRGFSHHFGLNDFFVGDATTSFARNVAVRSDIVAAPQLISRGAMADPPTAINIGNNIIAPGDNTAINRLAAIMSTDIAIGSSGGLPAITGTLANYSAQVLGLNASNAAEASDGLIFRRAVFQDITFRVSSQSGVNIDEEMAQLVTLQNAYAAAARVFSIAAEMMRTLEDIGR